MTNPHKQPISQTAGNCQPSQLQGSDALSLCYISNPSNGSPNPATSSPHDGLLDPFPFPLSSDDKNTLPRPHPPPTLPSHLARTQPPTILNAFIARKNQHLALALALALTLTYVLILTPTHIHNHIHNSHLPLEHQTTFASRFRKRDFLPRGRYFPPARWLFSVHARGGVRGEERVGGMESVVLICTCTYMCSFIFIPVSVSVSMSIPSPCIIRAET